MIGDDELAALAARLRSLGGAADSAAKIAAPKIAALISERAASGVDPAGKEWLAKKDGTRALANVAGSISAVAEGSVVIVKLVGAYVYHNALKGRRRRQVLPDGKSGLPAEIAVICKAAFVEACTRVMRK